MKRLALLVALSLIGGQALAADFPPPIAPPPAPAGYFPVAPLYSWTGFYVGGNLGAGWNNASFSIRHQVRSRPRLRRRRSLAAPSSALITSSDRPVFWLAPKPCLIGLRTRRIRLRQQMAGVSRLRQSTTAGSRLRPASSVMRGSVCCSTARAASLGSAAAIPAPLLMGRRSVSQAIRQIGAGRAVSASSGHLQATGQCAPSMTLSASRTKLSAYRLQRPRLSQATPSASTIVPSRWSLRG